MPMGRYRDDRPVIYVSGPITAPNAWLKEKNIRVAEEAGLLLALEPFLTAPIVPHTGGRFFGGMRDRRSFMECDFAHLSRCDGMVVLPGWEHSEGCKDEVAYANETGIPYMEISLKDFDDTEKSEAILTFTKSLKLRRDQVSVDATFYPQTR